MDQEENKLIYLKYRRRSTNENSQANSPVTQDRDIKAKFSKLKVVNLPIENGTAYEPEKRPIFRDMLQRIKNGEADGIVAFHPDRLSRNEVDAAQITYMFRKGVIKDIKFAHYEVQNRGAHAF